MSADRHSSGCNWISERIQVHQEILGDLFDHLCLTLTESYIIFLFILFKPVCTNLHHISANLLHRLNLHDLQVMSHLKRHVCVLHHAQVIYIAAYHQLVWNFISACESEAFEENLSNVTSRKPPTTATNLLCLCTVM